MVARRGRRQTNDEDWEEERTRKSKVEFEGRLDETIDEQKGSRVSSSALHGAKGRTDNSTEPKGRKS